MLLPQYNTRRRPSLVLQAVKKEVELLEEEDGQTSEGSEDLDEVFVPQYNTRRRPSSLFHVKESDHEQPEVNTNILSLLSGDKEKFGLCGLIDEYFACILLLAAF